MSKTAQAMNLSKWFGIDRILFGDKNVKKLLGESDFEKYNIAKGAILSNLFEIYKTLEYDPNLKLTTSKQMKEFAFQNAEMSLDQARNALVQEEASKQIVKEIEKICKREKIQDSSIIAEELIDRNIKCAALDIYLLEDSIENCKDSSILSETNGKIMISAYKKLRDAIVKYTRE